MTAVEGQTHIRRIYPLDPRELREEQMAVAFAMTSRRPEPFDQIAREVTEEKAADFHERWVLNYGHSSVAEHAILHMAVENISRLACDDLEDNRLASYTEQSTRYQVLEPGHYYTPPELEGHPIKSIFVSACDHLFQTYTHMVAELRTYLPKEMPRKDKERDSAYNLRIRRTAVDSCRFVLPASTLTNVGVTINARSLEHAIRKFLSSDLQEEREIGQELKERGQQITPTLIKYADFNAYLASTRKAQKHEVQNWRGSEKGQRSNNEIRLVHWDSQAEEKLAAAFLYRFSDIPYTGIWSRVCQMDRGERERLIDQMLHRLGPHDTPVREMETVDYTFDMVMDYGAYREFKRHRMQTYIAQPLTVEMGYVIPPLIERAGLKGQFEHAMRTVEAAFHRVAEKFPRQREYLVTHAHRRRVLSKMNLRECYHLFKLRTQPTAHFTLQEMARRSLALVEEKHPLLFRYLQLRSESGNQDVSGSS
ncbi:MAG: FAD-dependent thymidylate synthase [Chloroflexi bacterium]|nr:FAD-dependent thymidylate synthase [Chloroflexota bacterium]